MKDVIYFSLNFSFPSNQGQFIFSMPSVYSQNQYIRHLSASFVPVAGAGTVTPLMHCWLYAHVDNAFGGVVPVAPMINVDVLSPTPAGGENGAVWFNSNMPLTNIKVPAPVGFYYFEFNISGGVTECSGGLLIGLSND